MGAPNTTRLYRELVPRSYRVWYWPMHLPDSRSLLRPVGTIAQSLRIQGRNARASPLIFATVGTHTTGFARLVSAVDAVAATLDESVEIQIGSGRLEPTHASWFRYASPAEIDRRMDECRVVITHAGAGTLLNALERRRPVVVMPRLRRFGEVLDDHQLELSDALEAQGVIRVVHDAQALHEAVRIGPVRDSIADPSSRRDLIAEIRTSLMA